MSLELRPSEQTRLWPGSRTKPVPRVGCSRCSPRLDRANCASYCSPVGCQAMVRDKLPFSLYRRALLPLLHQPPTPTLRERTPPSLACLRSKLYSRDRARSRRCLFNSLASLGWQRGGVGVRLRAGWCLLLLFTPSSSLLSGEDAGTVSTIS